MAESDVTVEAEALLGRLDRRVAPVDLADDLAAIDGLLGRAHDERLRPAMIAALLSAKARTLAVGGETDAAIEQFDEIVSSYQDADDPRLAHEVDFALMSKAKLQLVAGIDWQPGALTFDTLLTRVAAAPADRYAPFKAQMVLEIGPLLLAQGEFERVVRLHDGVVALLASEAPRLDLVAEATCRRLLLWIDRTSQRRHLKCCTVWASQPWMPWRVLRP